MLDDPRSNRVKGITRLSQKDARYETGLFLLEGPQGLKELGRSKDLVEEIFVTAAGQERYADLLRLFPASVQVEVSDQVMARIADTKTPQGIVSVVHHVDVPMDELLRLKPKLVAIIDQGRDPGNIGTIIRAADAAGADGIILSADSVDIYNQKVARSTAGSILNIPIVLDQDLGEAISMLKEAGLQVFSTAASGRSIAELDKAILAKPTAWIFGNEAHVVSGQVALLADDSVSLPIYGSAESLNLATAASVCLYFTAVAQQSSH